MGGSEWNEIKRNYKRFEEKNMGKEGDHYETEDTKKNRNSGHRRRRTKELVRKKKSQRGIFPSLINQYLVVVAIISSAPCAFRIET